MIDIRILALVAGTLSLGFGIWAVTGAPSEVGLAAGALGLVAGLVSLVPNPSRAAAGPVRSADDPKPGPDPAEAPGQVPTMQPEPVHGAGSNQGYFDLDARSSRTDRTDVADMGTEPVSEPVATVAGSNDESKADGTSASPTPPPLTDPATGLFSEDYLEVALEGRLASARRHLRPVALALMQVTQGLPDLGSRQADPVIVAAAITNTVRDSDIACRLDDGTFGVILEDTPENGAVWTVERIRRNLVSTAGHHTLWAGVACYPAHAFDSAELRTQVSEALEAAKEWNQDRIEVALAD